MKLFNVIAAAAVIGTSLITANPAQARNGWKYMGEVSDGSHHYVKPLGKTGNMASFISNWSDMKPYTIRVNCNAWEQKFDSSSSWRAIMPGSTSDKVANMIC